MSESLQPSRGSPPGAAQAVPAPRGVRLQVIDLHKSFDRPVINGLTFEVAPGEVFVIMGPSGSGESVLLKHLIGLESPDQGQILIEGESIQQPEFRDQYRLAMVFQSGALLNSLTVAENVGLYLAEHRLKSPEEIDRIVTEKLEFLGLKGVKDRFPNTLSGGMKKRVAIARALIIDPQLILYDEPTSELDPLMAVLIGQEILNLKQRIGVTSVVVTHDRDLAINIADRIAIIMDGKLLAIGPTADFKQPKDPVIANFLNPVIDLKNPRFKQLENNHE